MAIVQDDANPGIAADKSFCSPNRTNAGSPSGSLIPQYAGEIVLDTTNGIRWRASGTANTDWHTIDAPVTP